MKKVDDRCYVDGKLVYARRSNVGLETDELLPGPGGGVPRRIALTTTALAESVWSLMDKENI